jgi:DNA repair exonuclease SbcCD nuclease subunit
LISAELALKECFGAGSKKLLLIDGSKGTPQYTHEHETVAVWGIPYHSDNRMQEFFANCQRIHDAGMISEATTKIVVLHQALKEAKIKNAPIDLKQELSIEHIRKYFSWSDLVVVGHYHDAQRLGKKLLIPGAVCQNSFRDANGIRGAWVFDTEKGLKHIPFEGHKFRIIDGNSDAIPTLVQGDRARIAINDAKQIKQFNKEYADSGASISYTLIADTSDVEKVRDASITFTNDDYENLVKYIKNEAPDTINKTNVEKYGKDVIQFVMDGGV